jgi:hypothetical protein
VAALEPDVEARLLAAGVLDPDGERRVELLAGGYWNRVARVRGAGVDLVVKRYARGGPALFPIDPPAEARALEVLRGHALAPEPVAFLPGDERAPAILVYAFHPGRGWDGDVAAVAALQRRQHALAVDGFRSVPRDPAGIVAQGDALLASAPAAARATVRARRPAPATHALGPVALLHTDAGPANLVDGQGGLRLIDWQCPALGDPAEDLFSFASPAFQLLSSRPPLDAATRRAYLEAYGDERAVARLHALWPAFTYRMAAYCAVRRAELAARDPEGSARYAAALAASLEEL